MCNAHLIISRDDSKFITPLQSKMYFLVGHMVLHQMPQKGDLVILMHSLMLRSKFSKFNNVMNVMNTQKITSVSSYFRP